MLSEELKIKARVLEDTKSCLKNKFIGIDDVIDRFIDSIRIWYLMPELMTRPMIINLWGLTGCGKTDLVRTFVKLIKMSKSFVELQMDSASSYSSIQSHIEYSDINPEDQSILLLDEIQRFRAINENGEEIKSKNGLNDIWMLLSDGKFQSESAKKRNLMEIIFEDLYASNSGQSLPKEAEVPEEKKEDKIFKYKQSYWHAQRLKKLLNCSSSIEEIMQWDYTEKMAKVKEAIDDDTTFEGISFSKMLIIIAGNIDEAYSMSSAVSNADTDADVFHEFSKRVSVVNIKDALSKRFKPEQVARFGNNHIIYPSLSRSSYKKIILNTINSIIKKTYDLHKINIKIDNSIIETIYENGVFPAQGVRPVYSTISTIFESYLPKFLFIAKETDSELISLSYKDSFICGTIGNDSISCKTDLSIRKIKESRTIDEITGIAVHEAGHAIIYALLHRISPTQIMCGTSNTDNEGFTGVHSISYDRNYIRTNMIVFVAGQIAEEIVFGTDYRSTGSSQDLSIATRLAASYVRNWGFDGVATQVRSIGTPESHLYNIDIEGTNAAIENLVKEAKNAASDLIIQHMALFKSIVKELILNRQISSENFVKLFEKHNEKISIKPIKDTIVRDFSRKWLKFIEE